MQWILSLVRNLLLQENIKSWCVGCLLTGASMKIIYSWHNLERVWRTATRTGHLQEREIASNQNHTCDGSFIHFTNHFTRWYLVGVFYRLLDSWKYRMALMSSYCIVGLGNWSDQVPFEVIMWWVLNIDHFSKDRSIGHRDTDKWTAVKVSPSPNFITKYSFRSRGTCVVW